MSLLDSVLGLILARVQVVIVNFFGFVSFRKVVEGHVGWP